MSRTPIKNLSELNKNGRIIGKLITYYPNGKIRSTTEYKSGKKHGSYLSYYNNGQPEWEGVYGGNQKGGVWTYYSKKGEGSFKIERSEPSQKISARILKDKKEIVIMGSRSHGNQELEDYVNQKKNEYQNVEFIPAGSSLKFTLIAEGKADIYPRLGPTMEWDTAAAHAIVLESGKQVLKYGTNEPLRYNKENLLNPWFIVE